MSMSRSALQKGNKVATGRRVVKNRSTFQIWTPLLTSAWICDSERRVTPRGGTTLKSVSALSTVDNDVRSSLKSFLVDNT